MALERQTHQLRNARLGLAFMQTGTVRRCLRQLVVFPLKGLIHSLLGSRLKGSSAARNTNTDRQHHAKMDIAFFAPLSKFHFFQGTDESPLVAKITDNEPIVGCQLSPQMTSETWIASLHGCCLVSV
jgi:hypothetical protein